MEPLIQVHITVNSGDFLSAEEINFYSLILESMVCNPTSCVPAYCTMHAAKASIT